MSAKHTPLPWEIEVINGGKDILINSKKRHIAKIIWYGMEKDEFDDANARLIAAAPELLEVLKKAIDNLDFGGEPKTAIGHAIRKFQEEAKQAIAHAEGK